MLLKFVALTANHLVNNGRAWCLVSKIGEKKQHLVTTSMAWLPQVT